jgi:hypothetical protein
MARIIGSLFLATVLLGCGGPSGTDNADPTEQSTAKSDDSDGFAGAYLSAAGDQMTIRGPIRGNTYPTTFVGESSSPIVNLTQRSDVRLEGSDGECIYSVAFKGSTAYVLDTCGNYSGTYR